MRRGFLVFSVAVALLLVSASAKRECDPDYTCGGHGTCDGEKNQCVCYDDDTNGHWEGKFCRKCQDDWYGLFSDCTIHCNDEDTCSGNGVCTSTGSCLCYYDHGHGYWTGANCSQCADNFYGERCTEYCLAQQTCHTHGTCNPTNGVCECFNDDEHGHWSGQLCNLCSEDYYYPGSACQTHCTDDVTCSGHGFCHSDGTCVCYYDIVNGYWSGPDCGVCYGNYYTDSCTVLCTAADTCNGHGECDGHGSCVCYNDDTNGHWSGDFCDNCETNWYPESSCLTFCDYKTSCSGHGSCSSEGDCKCDDNDLNGHWNGTSCNECVPDYYGDDCTAYCVAEVTCNGHGICGQDGECACDDSTGGGVWDGDSCSHCGDGYFGVSCVHPITNPAAPGIPELVHKAYRFIIVSVTNPPAHATGMEIEIEGPNGQYAYAVTGDLAPGEVVVHNFSALVPGTVYFFSARVKNVLGFWSNFSDVLEVETVGLPLVCKELASSVCALSCFLYDDCFTEVATSCNGDNALPYVHQFQEYRDQHQWRECGGTWCSPCFDEGTCDDGICHCNANYTGDFCQIPLHPKPCPNDCSQHGRCLLDGVCQCFIGYGGAACDDYLFDDCCPRGCSGRGICQDDGSCECDVGYYGEDCAQKIPANARGASCQATGDPHFLTFDGLRYDLQGEGVYYLIYSEDFAIQEWHEPYHYNPRAWVNKAVGIRYKSTSIEMYGGDPTTAPLIIHQGETIVASNHWQQIGPDVRVQLRRQGQNTRRLTWKIGEDITMDTFVYIVGTYQIYTNVFVRTTKNNFGQLEGLCGYYDNNRNDDLRLRGNDLSIDFHKRGWVADMYRYFAPTWRVPCDEMILTHVPRSLCENIEPTPELDHPGRCNAVAGLAEDVCSMSCTQFDRCVFDVYASCTLRAADGHIDIFAQYRHQHKWDQCGGDKWCEPCSGHGMCRSDGTCACDLGWRAVADCSIPENVPSCPDDCNDRGVCTQGTCYCDAGYGGDACENEVPIQCEGGCGNHGECSPNGVCDCDDDHYGQHCEFELPAHPSIGQCVSWGDPHITTFDGKKFSYQNAGVFVLVDSEELKVQAWAKLRGNRVVRVNKAIAAKYRNTLVEVYAQTGENSNRAYGMVLVDGVSVNVAQGTCYTNDDLELCNVAVVNKKLTRIQLNLAHDADDSDMTAVLRMDVYRRGIINFYATLHPGWFNRVEGLCGYYDGKRGDELRVRGTGEVVRKKRDIQHIFVPSWQIPCDHNFFKFLPADECRIEPAPTTLPAPCPDIVDDAREACKHSCYAYSECLYDVYSSCDVSMALVHQDAGDEMRQLWGLDCPAICQNECSGNGICTTEGKCVCGPGFVGDDCSIPKCSSECLNGGLCTPNDVCCCLSGYYGESCEISYCAAVDDCQPGGFCSGMNNTCSCYLDNDHGFWSSPYCHNCLDGYYGGSCKGVCPGYPQVCSGNGACDDGTEGDGRCTCQSGYFGTSCGGECPGGADNPCSGFGTCSDGASGTGQCTCFPSFYGTSCADVCPGGPTHACGDHGTCSDGASGDGLCTCESGYFGEGCTGVCPGGADNPCNGHGTCSDGREGTGVCVCDKYFNGDSCGFDIRQVSPVLECVAENANGQWQAYFGYSNANGYSGTIDYGMDNKILPDTHGTPQPVDFSAGRTPPFPNNPFFVVFDENETLRWVLGTSSVSASSQSLYCSAVETIVPVLDCVYVNLDETFTAHFGYENHNPFYVPVTIGQENYFTPGSRDVGQPTYFRPGRTTYFEESVAVTGHFGDVITWHLVGQTVEATKDSPQQCPERPCHWGCSDHGTCVSGVCVCDKGYMGIDCSGGDSEIQPKLECVGEVGDGSYLAYFKYSSKHDVPLYVNVGDDNMFVPSPADRGQPIIFEPEGSTSAFSASFSDESTLTWSVGKKSVTASNRKKKCGPVIPVEVSVDCIEKYNDGSFDVFFAYNNRNPYVVETKGSKSKLVPSSAGTPVRRFLPGAHSAVFRANSPDGSPVTWIVVNEGATASSDSHTCGAAPPSTPIISVVKFSDDLLTLLVDFDRTTDMGGLGSTTSCAELLGVATLGLVGESMSCSWERDASRLVVELSAQSTITIGDDFSLLPVVRNSDSSSGAVTTVALVRNPDNPPVVIAVVDGPSNIGSCDDVIVLDGRGSSGAGGRSLVYSWVVVQQPATDLQTDIGDESILTIPLEDLHGGDYVIRLTVTNFITGSSFLVHSFTYVDHGMISVAVSPKNIEHRLSFTRSDRIQFTADVASHSCIENPRRELSYVWTVQSGPDVTIRNSDKKEMFVRETDLVQGRQYVFQVSVTKVGDVELTGSDTGVLRVIALIPGVHINGNLAVTRPDDTISLEAVVSNVDPSAALVYEWSCVYQSDGNACEDEHGHDITFPTTSSISLPTEDLKVDSDTEVLVFDCVVREGTSVLATDQALVSVSTSLPVVTVNVVQEGSSNKRTIIRATSNVHGRGVTYQWSATIVSSGAAVDLQSWAVRGQTNKKTLTIKEGTLEPGVQYSFKCVVSQDGVSGEGDVTISLPHPPSGGSVVVDPDQGSAYGAQFRIVASGFSDFWGFLLRFRFSYRVVDDPNGRRMFLSDWSSTYRIRSRLPCLAGRAWTTVRITVEVRSFFGSIGSHSFDVRVSAPSSSQYNALLSSGIQEEMMSGEVDGTLGDINAIAAFGDITAKEGKLSSLLSQLATLPEGDFVSLSERYLDAAANVAESGDCPPVSDLLSVIGRVADPAMHFLAGQHISSSALNSGLRALSGLATASAGGGRTLREEGTGMRAVDAVRGLALSAQIDRVCDEEAIEEAAGMISSYSVTRGVDSIKGSQITPSADSSVDFPEDFLSSADGCVVLRSSHWKDVSLFFPDTGLESWMSDVVSVGVSDPSTGVDLAVRGLTNPVLIQIPLSGNSENVESGSCVYWDNSVGKWSTSGMTRVSLSDTHVTCSSTHLSDFSYGSYVASDEDEDDKKSSDSTAMIIISGVAVVAALVVAVFLISFIRKRVAAPIRGAAMGELLFSRLNEEDDDEVQESEL